MARGCSSDWQRRRADSDRRALKPSGGPARTSISSHAGQGSGRARMSPKDVLCQAHVANRLGRVERDFETGEHDGARAALRVIEAIARVRLAREDGVRAAPTNRTDRHAG